MPPDIYTYQEDALAAAGALGKAADLRTVFQVPEEDFRALFSLPKLDADVQEFLKNSATASQSNFIKSWEVTLTKIDKDLRAMSRLSAFQLLVLNALTIHLSDNCAESEASAKDGPFAMARLAADLASRQVNMALRFSAHMTRERRSNVYAGLRGDHKDRLVTKLKKLDLNNDTVFGGSFSKSMRKVVKEVQGEKALGLQRQAFSAPASKSRGRSSSRASQRRSTGSDSRNHPYASRGSRGRGRGRSSSYKAPASTASSRGGAQGGRKQQRGRGRGGRPWKRF